MKRWQLYFSVGLLICGCLFYASDSIHANGNAGNSNLESAQNTLSDIQLKIQENGPIPELLAQEQELRQTLSTEGETTEEALARKAQELADEGVVTQETSVQVQSDPDKEDNIAQDRALQDLLRRYNEKEDLSASELEMVDNYFRAVSESDGRDEVNPLDDTGGPSPFGYTWVDSLNGDTAHYNWIELSTGTGATELTTISSSDDGNAAFSWGWNFLFYGVTYSNAFVTPNGYIAFTASGDFSNECPRSAGTPTGPTIFTWWDDGHTSYGNSPDGGKVLVQDFGTYVVITWDSIGTCCTNLQTLWDYQCILHNNGKIKFQYRRMTSIDTNSPTPTIGIQQSNSAGALDYLNYACDATQVPNAAFNNGAYDGRAIWFNPPNVAEDARCCYLNAGSPACVDNSLDECNALSGLWSPGATCAGNPCPVARCCYNNGANCADNTQLECNALGGTWSVGLTCAANPCPATIQGGETCADAVPITIGQVTIGTTVNFLDDDPGTQCALGSTDPYEGSNTAPDVWYSLVGNGNQLTVTTCASTGYDSQIAVFCGECEFLSCVAGNDDAGASCTFSTLRSTATFCSQLNQTYYIVVDGWGIASGAYNVLVSDGPACNNPINCAPEARCCYLDNGVAACVDNLQSDCIALNGQWTASATCASAPCPVGRCCYLDGGVAACADNTELECIALNGQWTATETCASTPCPVARCCYLDNGLGACIDNTELECNTLSGQWSAGLSCTTDPCPLGRCCFNGGDDCADNTELECATLAGTWTAGYTCAANPCPTILNGADECADAVAIPAIPGSYAGTTIGSTAETVAVPATCGTSHGATDPGVWYTLLGTGNTITVSLCDPLTDAAYDTKIFIFCGECDALTCVEGDDDACTTPALASTQAFCSQSGQTYFILISGFLGDTGNYLLSVTDDGTPCNTQVNCAPEARCCYLDNGVAACANLLQGDCNNLGGTWTATVTCESSPCPTGRCCYLDNGLGACIVNTQLECTALAGQWTSGSTCATPCPTGRCCYLDNGVGACAVNIQLECTALAGQWTSGSTCATPCPVGRCCYLDGNVQACADNIQLECNALGGIWGTGVSCDANPCPDILLGADLCEDAVAIPAIPGSYGGTTVGSTPEVGIPAACGSGYNTAASGVWYTVLGTGNSITVSLCDPITSYDTELFVFCGLCDALACLDGDDDDCTTPALASTLTFCSQAGATYRILVTAFGTATGSFAMNITDDGVACTPTVICVVPCDPVLDLVIYNVPVGSTVDHVRLNWTAPQLSDYRIYSTTHPTNDGDPDNGTDPDWTAEATLFDLPAGPQSWESPAASIVTYKNYVVTAICGE